MADKRMLIIDAEVANRIEENRGDMSISEFITFLIESQMKEEPVVTKYVDRDEFEHFSRGMKELLRNFMDFFVSYGMELGEEPKDKTFQELTKKLQSFASSENKTKPNKSS